MRETNIAILIISFLALFSSLISESSKIEPLDSLSARLDSLKKSIIMYSYLKNELSRVKDNDELSNNDIDKLIKLSKALSEYTSVEINTNPNDTSYQQKLNFLIDEFYKEYTDKSNRPQEEATRVILETSKAKCYIIDETRQMPVLEPEPLMLEPEPLSEEDIWIRWGKSFGWQRGITLIIIGNMPLYSLESPANTAAELPLTSGGDSWRYYLVVFQFTLNPLPPGWRYKEVIFQVVVSDPKITVIQLLPEEVVQERKEEVTQFCDIGFSIPLSGEIDNTKTNAEVSTKKTQTIKFTHLRPIITAFRDRQSSFFWWKFSGPSRSPVEPGSHRTAAVLQVPNGVNRLKGKILLKVDLEENFFGDWSDKSAIDTIPFELQLNLSLDN